MNRIWIEYATRNWSTKVLAVYNYHCTWSSKYRKYLTLLPTTPFAPFDIPHYWKLQKIVWAAAIWHLRADSGPVDHWQQKWRSHIIWLPFVLFLTQSVFFLLNSDIANIANATLLISFRIDYGMRLVVCTQSGCVKVVFGRTWSNTHLWSILHENLFGDLELLKLSIKKNCLNLDLLPAFFPIHSKISSNSKHKFRYSSVEFLASTVNVIRLWTQSKITNLKI